ncbi:hypothetical protein HB904_04355 [Listeria booriae]|uniref:Uncharacterized protein n=1 Tax=Listeria booriae TaxID=1552123 RepID=A0A842A943_9LIST|nr:hypothetical protein [Listeria booriae]MBC1615406.1 hypothetical protein [Listeria booriae]
MTVGELIERLKELPETASVMVSDGGVKLWAEKVTITTNKEVVVNIEAWSDEE